MILGHVQTYNFSQFSSKENLVTILLQFSLQFSLQLFPFGIGSLLSQDMDEAQSLAEFELCGGTSLP